MGAVTAPASSAPLASTTPASALPAAESGFDAEAINSLSLAELHASGTRKWTGFPGNVALWVAEMDFPVAAPITAALQDAVARNLFGYLPGPLVEEAKQACANWYRRSFGWEITSANVTLVPDVLVGLRIALDALTGPGSTAIVTTPAYMPFLTHPTLMQHSLLTVAATQHPDGHWEHDLDALDAALASVDGPALVVLCNPWNPVGRVLTRSELLALAEVVERNGATVFSDEIHAPVTFRGAQHIPYASLNETTAEHTITAVSASKAWNLPGLKCAQLISTSKRISARLAEPGVLTGYEPAILGLVANIAAYNDGAPWLADALDFLAGSQELLAAELATAIPQARYAPAEGTYLAWVDLREVRTPSGKELPADLGRFFREKASVALQDGSGCGLPGFIRINLGTAQPVLRDAVRALGQAIADLD